MFRMKTERVAPDSSFQPWMKMKRKGPAARTAAAYVSYLRSKKEVICVQHVFLPPLDDVFQREELMERRRSL